MLPATANSRPASRFVGAMLLVALLLATLGTATAQDDGGARAAFAEGLRLAKAGELDKAIARFDAVLRIDADFPGARRNRGLLQARTEHWDAAVRDLRVAVAQDPEDAESRLALGQCFRQLDQPVAAELPLRQALLIAPDDPAIYAALAQVLIAQSRPEPAVAAAAAATRLAPARPEYWRVLGEARLAADDLPGAIDALEATRRLLPAPDPALYWTLGELYVLAGMDDEASARFTAALAVPDTPISTERLYAAINALDAGHATPTHPLVSRFLAAEPDSARAHRLRADGAEAGGDLPAAIQHARAAVAADAASPDTHLALARLLLEHGEFDAAIDHARHARALPAGRLPALHLEASITIRASRWADALAAVDALADADPDHDYSEIRAQIAALVKP